MSIRILILKDGVITPSRSSADNTAIANSLPVPTNVQSALSLKADLVDGKIPSAQLPAGSTTSLTLGDTSSTAYRGDFGTLAYNHSQITGNPHGTTKIDIGLGALVNSLQLVASSNLSDLVNRQTALNNIAGAVTTGSYLRADGTNVILSTIQVSDIPILNQNTTGTASNVTGIVGISNGGTGSSTQNWIDLTTNQTVAGNKTFTGILNVPTAVAGTNTTQAASTGFVSIAIGNLINSAPGVLDTLNELSAALGNDPNFATTITNSLALKAPLASPTFTGTISGITAAMVGLNLVNNTSDLSKPISTATQLALNLKADLIDGKVPTSQLPTGDGGSLTLGNTSDTAYRGDYGTIAYNHSQITSGNPHGLTATSINLGNVDNTSDTNKPVSIAQQSALNLKADLVGGIIPASQLPGYVDDYLEYINLASFPITGETGKLYFAIDTNQSYRWTGSVYAVISSSLALGVTSSTAYRGDLGNIAYLHSQLTGNPHGTTKTDVGLDNVINSLQLTAINNLSDLNNRQTALNNLVGAVTANRVLKGDGSSISLAQVNLGSLDVTGVLSVLNGGTGSSTQTWVDLLNHQTINGEKTFTERMYVPQLYISDNPHISLNNNIGLTYFKSFPDFYQDYKVSTNGFIRFRCGAGTEFGYSRQFMSVVASNGDIAFKSTTQSTSFTTGALTVAGGVGIVGNNSVGGFTSLGDSNVGIKVKVMYFTSPPDSNLSAVLFDLPPMEKIVSITGMIHSTTTDYFPPNHYGGSFYGNTKLWSIYPYLTFAYVSIHPDAVASLANRPGKLCITYIG